MNSWRKARNRLAAYDRRSGRGEQPAPSPDALALASALQLIPKAQRQVIVLYYVVDLSIDEIAQELGASTGTVKARLARGRRALAPLVSEFGDDEPRPGPPTSRSSRTAHSPQPSPGSTAGPDLDFHHPQPDWETSTHA